MIQEDDVLLLHDFSIRDFGGSSGVRDRDLLLSAIARPYQTFDGVELYVSPIEKAAALGESLIINHPFLDGNKRTALLAMISVLYEANLQFTAENGELYDFIIEMSTGKNKFDEIVAWLKMHTK